MEFLKELINLKFSTLVLKDIQILLLRSSYKLYMI